MSKEVSRSIRLNFKITEDEFFDLERNFNMIHHNLGGKEQESRLEVWRYGVEMMLKKISQTTNGKAKEAAKRASILEKTRLIKERNEEWRMLEKIFDELPPEEFQQWCRDKEIDLVPFLEWRDSRQAENKTQELDKWLSGILRSGDPVPVSKIKELAIAENIIEKDNAEQWTYVRVVAGRLGYTKLKRGFWQNGFHSTEDNSDL